MNTHRSLRKNPKLEQLNRELEVGQVDEVIMNESETEDEDEEQEQEQKHSSDRDGQNKDNPTNDKDKPATKHKR